MGSPPFFLQVRWLRTSAADRATCRPGARGWDRVTCPRTRLPARDGRGSPGAARRRAERFRLRSGADSSPVPGAPACARRCFRCRPGAPERANRRAATARPTPRDATAPPSFRDAMTTIRRGARARIRRRSGVRAASSRHDERGAWRRSRRREISRRGCARRRKPSHRARRHGPSRAVAARDGRQDARGREPRASRTACGGSRTREESHAGSPGQSPSRSRARPAPRPETRR